MLLDYTSCMYGLCIGGSFARISVLLFTNRKIIKSYTGSSIKLSRSNLFRLYFIEKGINMGAYGRKFEETG